VPYFMRRFWTLIEKTQDPDPSESVERELVFSQSPDQ